MSSTGPTGAGGIASSDSLIACSTGSTQSCTASYPSGTQVTLAANVNTGFALSTVSWPGCASSSTTCTLTLTQDTDVTAAFTTGLFALTVTQSSHGTVTSNDHAINCGNMCSNNYAYQSSITLTASPNSGGNYNFESWTGGSCDGQTSPTCSITMQAAAVTITANYHNNDE